VPVPTADVSKGGDKGHNFRKRNSATHKAAESSSSSTSIKPSVPVPTADASKGGDKGHNFRKRKDGATHKATETSSSSTAIKPKDKLHKRGTTPPKAPELAGPALPLSFVMAAAYAKDQHSGAPTAPTSAAAPAAPAVPAARASLPVPDRSVVRSPRQDVLDKLEEPLRKHLQTDPEPEIGSGLFPEADQLGTKGRSILTAFYLEDEDEGGFKCTICGDIQTEDRDALEHQRKRHFTKEGTGTGNESI